MRRAGHGGYYTLCGRVLDLERWTYRAMGVHNGPTVPVPLELEAGRWNAPTPALGLRIMLAYAKDHLRSAEGTLRCPFVRRRYVGTGSPKRWARPGHAGGAHIERGRRRSEFCAVAKAGVDRTADKYPAVLEGDPGGHVDRNQCEIWWWLPIVVARWRSIPSVDHRGHFVVSVVRFSERLARQSADAAL